MVVLLVVVAGAGSDDVAVLVVVIEKPGGIGLKDSVSVSLETLRVKLRRLP